MNNHFERLMTEQLIALWEELTINKPYVELVRRYAVILTNAKDIATIHDLLAIDVYLEFGRRGLKAPMPNWAFGR